MEFSKTGVRMGLGFLFIWAFLLENFVELVGSREIEKNCHHML
jgi:hypothetical protein